jgi:3-dehydroquinate synthetase
MRYPGLISDWLTTRLYWHQSTPKGLIITDDNVSDHALRVQNVLAADKWSTTILTLPAGEQTKSLAHLASIYTQLTQMQADRKTMIFAVGGGVIGDLAGFCSGDLCAWSAFRADPDDAAFERRQFCGG